MLQYHACACYCIHCHIVINDLNSIARAPTLECVFKVKCSRDHESIYIANIIKPYGKTDYHSQSAKIKTSRTDVIFIVFTNPSLPD